MVSDKLHIICGNCGQDLTEKNMASYEIIEDGNIDQNGNGQTDILITCLNCSTVHSLNKYIEKEQK